VKSLVLSGALAIVLSGARSSCYRVQSRELSPCSSIDFGNRNFTNEKYFVFLLTRRPSGRPVHNLKWPMRRDP
jgi:hypothetical protein